MHTFLYRLNALVTFAMSVLALLCFATTMTDCFHRASPNVDLDLTRFEFLLPGRDLNDEIRLIMSLDMDLSSSFSWNTKQLFVFIQAEYQTELNHLNQVILWDSIISKKEDAKLKKRIMQKYIFDDQGNHLRSKMFNLTVEWNIMPKVGHLKARSKSFTGFSMPREYTSS